MKHLTQLLLTIGTIVLLLSCDQKPTNNGLLFNIDLTKTYDEKPLVLNELSDDVRIIRLETNDQSLIRWFRGFVGAKYIVAFAQDKILLFTSTGKFIRTIAQKGKGPLEFQQLDAWAVDEGENYLFYSDVKRNYIYKYDLVSGMHDKIPFEDKGYLSAMLLVNDTTFAILPGNFSSYGYEYFYLSHRGNIIGGLKKEPVPHPGAWAGTSPVFMTTGDGSVVYHPSESDTIYRLKDMQLESIGAFRVEEVIKTGDKSNGYSATITYLDKRYLIVQKAGYEKELTKNSARMSRTSSMFYVIDRSNNSIEQSENFEYNFNGVELNLNYVSFPLRKQFVAQIQAVDFKEQLETTINGENCSEKQKRHLTTLNNEISEDDNPILITGHMN